MITKVILKNWRSHLNSELDFSSGTNALLGHLGSGKTSVLDSICFALFGTTPTLQTKKLKLDDVIMKKPIEKDRAEIEVHFQLDSSNYSVKRVIEKGKGTSYSEIRQDGKLIEAPSTSRVTELIEKILKVNYELFSKAIYSEQNALDYFLTLGKGQRMKKIDELLMIDKFEKARANAVSLTNKIAERKLAKQSMVEHVDITSLQKNIDDLKNSLIASLSEKQSFQRSLEEITVEKNNLEKEVSEIKKINSELEILKREEKGVLSAIQEAYIIIDNFEKKLKDLDRPTIEKNLGGVSKYLREVEQFIREKTKHYQKIQEQASKAKAEVELLKKEKIEKLESEFNEKLRIKNEFEKYKKEIGEGIDEETEKRKALLEKIIGNLEATRVKIEELEATVQQLSALKAKCPICESRLTESKKKILIKQKKTQIKSLKEELEILSKKKKLNERELRNLEEAADKLEEMLKELKDFDHIKFELENAKNIFTIVSENAVKLENELASLRKELEELQNKMKNATDEKQRFDLLYYQLREYENSKSRIEKLMKDREIIGKHIEETERGIAGKELDKLESRLRSLIAQEKELSTRIIGLEQLIQEKDTRLREFEDRSEMIQKEKLDIAKLDKMIKELKIFEKALEQTQIEMRTEFVTSVNYTMNNLWSTLYPYQDFVGIRLAIEEGDYVLQLQTQAREWMNVEGIASGGERSIAALALRIAFSLVMAPNLRILILDEPTMNLDTTAISVLASTLRERIQDFINQCFLITHQSELEGAAGNAYRLERDKSKDDVTKVIAIT